MPTYEVSAIHDLVDQLKRGPKRLRLKQLYNVSFLLTVVDVDKAYPFDFVQHTLTGYRAPGREPVDDARLLDGEMLRADLITLAEDLSDDADLPCEGWCELLYSVGELADRFGVSTKTIFRWRRRGLVGWRFRCDDGRKRMAFPESCVRRFVAENVELVNRGASFSQLSKSEREDIIQRAQALVKQGERTINSVAKMISTEIGRAVETIRLILKHYDEARPRTGLFNRPTVAPQADDRRLALWEGYSEGATIEALARRFNQPVRWVYDAITEMRARELRARKIEFVASEEFELENADEVILGDPSASTPYDMTSARASRTPADLPPYLQQLFRLPLLTREGEAALFRRMNYLKFKADRGRRVVDPEDASAIELDHVEALLEEAERVKNQIVQANLRLVVSIAKRHAAPDRDFFEIVSDGNISLMRAVDKFDYSRGFKFSTYASWAIMKNYARMLPEQRQHRDRYQTGRDEMLTTAPCPISEEHENDYLPAVRTALDEMLSALDDRSERILRRRFGLDDHGQSQTLEQIGRHFGVSKERVRQLETRAIEKLREDFSHLASKLLG